jgi:hypothetical protein
MADVSAARLRRSFKGALLTPADVGYDAARRIWNGMIDRRPGLIARCQNVADVQACVLFARENGVLLSVRGGGHNYAGMAVCDDGLMLDLSPMRNVVVDASKCTGRGQAGCTLGDFDRATQAFGMATPLGVATTTGISGLTLGGGYGWTAGKFGLACDNLLSAQVVTADGNIVECNEQVNADLFWGMRGAGANLGVATELEFRLRLIDRVLGGPILHPLTKLALRFFDELASNAPDELTVLGGSLMGPDDKPVFATLVCYCGDPAEGEKWLLPLRTYAKPIVDMIQMRPYLEMQSLFDPSYPVGDRYYNKSYNVSVVSDEIIDVVLEYSAKRPTSRSTIAFQQLHGAAARVPVGSTAFPHRYDHHVVWIEAIRGDLGHDDPMIQWARECWKAMGPYADASVYVNAVCDEIEGGTRKAGDAYGANYERLRDLKGKFDPDNVFRNNTNIEPRV